LEKIGDDCTCQQRGRIAGECMDGVVGVRVRGEKVFPPLPCSLDASNFVMTKQTKRRSTEGFKVDVCACGTNKLVWLERCIVCQNEKKRITG